jgi:integrase/recombinase XerD
LSKNATRLSTLTPGYQLYARSEGRSPRTIEILTSSIASLESFLDSQGVPPNTATIGPAEMRAFILYLQEKRCYSQHPYAPPQTRRLSAHTLNCYMRSIRAFWSWLVHEGIVDQNPFDVVKVPKAPVKLMPTFSNLQIRAFLDAIDTRTPEGFRDYAIILTLLDTGVRVSELTGLRMRDTRLDEGTLRVLGKGNKERLVPVGRGLKRLLWRYISGLHPQPALVGLDLVFLTVDGRPLTKNRVEAMMKKYGARARLEGVRYSPHTLRHTAAVSFLRNGGGAFSLQHVTGHSSLEVLRGYVNLVESDVRAAHRRYSPVDNLKMGPSRQPSLARPAGVGLPSKSAGRGAAYPRR